MAAERRMRRKTFGLIVVTTISGIVPTWAGCSEERNGERPVDGGNDQVARRLDGRDERADAFDPDARPPPGPCGPIDATKFPYTTAVVAPGACTVLEATAIADFYNARDAGSEVLISEWSKTVSASCAGCVFSDGTGGAWTPILTNADKVDKVNLGGCIEIVSGKEACGRSSPR